MLLAGIATVEFFGDVSRHEIYGLGTDRPYVIIDGSAVYFTIPDSVKLDEYYILSKMRDSNGQAEGKQKGRDVWKPVKLAAGNVLYIEKEEENSTHVLVINQTGSKFTTTQKVGIGLGIAAAAAVAAVAAVFVFPVGVAALGFGTAGIAAGSTAASMMSAGVVGVATLQSIGAAGMGIASTLAVGGLGAAVGTGAGVGGVAFTAMGAENVVTWEGAHYVKHLMYEATQRAQM
jgi:hypothetical protein